MDTKKIFEILEIEETRDEDLIKTAYRSKLVTVNPEDNPEGFKRLREAYEAALRFAASQEESPVEKPNDPVSLYIERLNSIYRSISKRLNPKEWKTLLKDELLDDLDLGEDAKWQLFHFLASNYKLPAEIWRLLDQTFHVREEEQKFKEHLPVNFVDYILWCCTEEAEQSQFPLYLLTGSDTADYDEFLRQLDELTNLASRRGEYEDNDQWLKEQAQKIAYLDTLGISHPYYELEKARYAMDAGQPETALQAADALMATKIDHPRILLGCARIYKNCGRKEDAEQIYRIYVDKDDSDDPEQPKERPQHSPGNIYVSAMALAEFLMERKDYVHAREYVLQAMDAYHTQEVLQLLNDSSNAIIEQLAGEQAPEGEPCLEDAILLADCYIDTNRAQEGVAYFEEHPILTEDSVKCRRIKALLYHAGGKYEEALAEILLWRKCLDADPESKPSLYVRNYVLEARVREQLYIACQDKQSQDALNHKQAAFEAFEKAFGLEVDDNSDRINTRINKVLFLRTIWEEEPSKEYYQQAATLCEEIIELDDGDYWAHHYAQEAYEKLGNAQKVVDYFYSAKKIYAGMPEIYERAAKVFEIYEQWNDLRHILDQAEEAGVESDRLKVYKMELLREEAKSKQEVWQAEVFCKRTIGELEEKLLKGNQEGEAMPEEELEQLKRSLSEAYRQRALLHDDNEKIKGFKKLDDIENWLLRSVELCDMFSNRYFLGYLYMYEKVNYQEAYKHLKICEEKGSNHWVFFRIALCHEEWAQWDDAIEYYKKGSALAPDHDDYLWRIAWLYRQKFIRTEQMEYYEEAIKYLDLQMERFGEHPKDRWEIWWQYSDLHTRKGDYEQALADIERAIKSSGRGRNWGHKADLLELLGRPQEAFAAYEKGIAVSRINKSDYAYGYTHIYQYFCRHRAYEDGIAWFESKMDSLLTEEQRIKNLGRVRIFYLKLKNWPKAMETLERMYGSTTLKDFVCRSWKEECSRIDDLLDAYQFWLSNEELDEKAQEAAALMEHWEEFKPEGNPETEKVIHEGKREVYMQIAYCYTDYLLDDETGIFYFEKALEHARLAGDETEDDDYRRIIHNIMGCLWHLGRTQEAIHYRRLYLRNLAKEYEECADLGKSLEDMYLQARNGRLNSYYLFQLEFFCGNYERAAELLEFMDCTHWCWHCRQKECSDTWECKGYMALIRGQKEEAIRCFEQAVACALDRNDQASCELRRLYLEKER